MSGLLRRIKRSRTADAGETPDAGRAAAPEGAPTTAGLPGRDPAPEAAPPPILADPDMPAGLDPSEARSHAPTVRRARLRRRLRYLRRARELMLRDLGGLLYEVHRTGGGDVGAHDAVIGAKVQRLASLDAEAGAIETALVAARADAVVFQPGVGGTCDFCGELHGSAARFCSHCGSPTGSAVRATPAPAAQQARPVPAMPERPAETGEESAQALPATKREQPTANLANDETTAAGGDTEALAADDETAGTAANEPAAASDAVDATSAGEPAAQAPADEAPAGDARSPKPFSGLGNGRADVDRAPHGPSSGDALARRSRS